MKRSSLVRHGVWQLALLLFCFEPKYLAHQYYILNFASTTTQNIKYDK